MLPSVTFKKLFPTDQVIQLVRERNRQLEERCGQFEKCNVVVEKPKRKPRKQSFQVRVFLEMTPKKNTRSTVVGNAESRELLPTIQKAFESVERQIHCPT